MKEALINFPMPPVVRLAWSILEKRNIQNGRLESKAHSRSSKVRANLNVTLSDF